MCRRKDMAIRLVWHFTRLVDTLLMIHYFLCTFLIYEFSSVTPIMRYLCFGFLNGWVMFNIKSLEFLIMWQRFYNFIPTTQRKRCAVIYWASLLLRPSLQMSCSGLGEEWSFATSNENNSSHPHLLPDTHTRTQYRLFIHFAPGPFSNGCWL